MHDDELLEYFEEKVSDEYAQVLEGHLAICDVCTARAREVYAFHELWSGWTATAHGRAHQHELVAEALRRATTSSADWKERLQRWRTQWRGLSEAALGFVMKGTAETANVVARSVDALMRPGSPWTLQPAWGADIARGDGLERQDEAELVTIPTPGHPTARVVVRAAERGEVEIRIDGLEPDAEPPLALLVAAGADASVPRITQAARIGEKPYCIARFVDVVPGEYLVLVEPLATAPARGTHDGGSA